MKRDDLPLIAFTLLVQLALGAVALAAMLPLRMAGQGDASPLVFRLLGSASSLLVLGMVLSLLHLGVPLGAMRAIRNLRTSWLSREVLFTGLFTALTIAAATVQRLEYRSADLLWLATLTGLAAVYTMARLYQATVRPAWATLYTPLSFFAAVVTLGAAAGAPLIMRALRSGVVEPPVADLLLRDIFLSGLAAVVVTLVASALYAGEVGERRAPLALRLALAVTGIAGLAYGWYLLIPGPIWLGALALAAGEVVARVRFFALP
jgi:anaerobic dimethyl sulfoxide reductase subunit C (anchor subunit)